MTHYPESMSGPRERKVAVDCSTCHIVESQTECKNCIDAICLDCAVMCGDCGTGPLCIPCAIKNGLTAIWPKWVCENCAPAYECELEEARR